MLLPMLLTFDQWNNTHDGIPNTDFMADCPSCGHYLYLSYQIGDYQNMTPSDTGNLLRLITCPECGALYWGVSGECAVKDHKMCSVATGDDMKPIYVVYGLPSGTWIAADESGVLATEDSAVGLFHILDKLHPFGGPDDEAEDL